MPEYYAPEYYVPEYYPQVWGDPEVARITATPTCDGPVEYVDRSLVDADIANLKANAGDAEVFMTAASPGIIEMYMPNRYYQPPRSTCSPSPTP